MDLNQRRDRKTSMHDERESVAHANQQMTEEELKEKALAYHANPQPGKFTIIPTKAMNNAQDLSLAYSPGVAYPCKEIEREPELAYRYTNKPNMVAVISNGTAVLGLGNLGALASKPVMEGKAVLFNKFAGIEAIDLCIDCKDPDELINIVKTLGPSFGGINLEDIKGPDCFKVERELKKIMPIPIFHDDQHGTAIICLAAILNGLQLVNKKIEDVKIVVQGAGAAGIACLNLIILKGANPNNALLLDSKGVIYKGRTAGMNEWKE